MKLRDLDLQPSPINDEHQALGLPPVEDAYAHLDQHPAIRLAIWAAALMLLAASAYLLTRFLAQGDSEHNLGLLGDTLRSRAFWSAVAVGLLAQTVDGALGMAYGITSTSFLLASGISPAVASASVHIAEVFTTGVSGIAHAKLGNVNRKLFLRLLIPGITGAVAGAWLVSSIDGKVLKPWISAYLFFMGLYVLSKVWRKIKPRSGEPRHVAKLALFGGFVDAVGGGGWGPVVTTTLVGTGHDPRTTIGSVNFAEFFLTFTSAIAFATLVDEGPWPVVAGLVLGGLFAAPLAAQLCRRLHARTLLILVGTLIAAISLWNLYRALIA